VNKIIYAYGHNRSALLWSKKVLIIEIKVKNCCFKEKSFLSDLVLNSL